MKEGSFSSNVLKQFKKNKLAVISLYVIVFLIFVAVFAPLIANNKPLFIKTYFLKKYKKNHNVVVQMLGRLKYRINKTNLKKRKSLIIKAINAVEINSEAMAEQLFTNNKNELLTLTSSFNKMLLKKIKNQTTDNFNINNKTLNELEKLKSIINTKFQHNKIKLKRRLYFPAIKALGWGDFFFMFLFILFCFYKKLKKLSKKIVSKFNFGSELNIPLTFALIIIPSFLFAMIWMIFFQGVEDNFNYKQTISNLTNKDYYMMPIVPFGENENILEHSREKPTWLLKSTIKKKRNYYHWLGTDTNGRDVLCRMVYGSRISMSVGFVAVSIYVAIGIILGAIAGYFRGWIDILISRLIEIMMTFPVFFLILIVLAMLKPSIMNIMIVIGLTGWTGVARLIRGEFLKLAHQDFVQAAKALGASTKRIIFKHILPNAIGPVLVAATFGIAGAILTESSLSFLGFGVPQPTASWGDILNNGRNSIQQTWWLTIFPGLAIFITITAYNLIGEGLRDAMDPRLKK